MSNIKFTGGAMRSPVTSSLADLVFTKMQTDAAISQLSRALSAETIIEDESMTQRQMVELLKKIARVLGAQMIG